MKRYKIIANNSEINNNDDKNISWSIVTAVSTLYMSTYLIFTVFYEMWTIACSLIHWKRPRLKNLRKNVTEKNDKIRTGTTSV